MMKRNIFKTFAKINKKFALCLIIAGFTAMNTGFTENGPETQSAVEAKIEIEQQSATEPTAIAVGENGRITISEDDELAKALAQLVENSQDVNAVETPSTETPSNENQATVENSSTETPSTETQAADVSNVEIVETVPVQTPENVIETERGLVPYTQMYGMEATAYLPTDGSPEGLTAMGIPATYGVVAVDPDVIPLGSRVYIPGYGEAIAADTGGAIYGYRIDLCMESYGEAMDFGRRNVTVFVLE
ncbi:MAG: 3D domain-containing protein [Selenomonadaceae bacterium]|nr:3D domain-containing protein [Selenomonadaceae bacterium]